MSAIHEPPMVYCPTCNGDVQLDAQEWRRQDHPISDEPMNRVVFGYCSRCGHPVLVRQDFVDESRYDQFIPTWGGDRQLYPLKIWSAPEHLPNAVKAVFDEAAKCFAVGAYYATVTMVGRCLEVMAKNKGVAENDLDGTLRALLKKGVLTQQMHQWATELRHTRSEGAHDKAKEIRRGDAEDAMRCLAAILHNAYEVDHDMRERQKARQERMRKAKQPPA